MLTLDQIRTYVRTHLDLDLEDMPDALVDVFIREGSKRVEKAASRWPFYEHVWTVATVAGQRSYSMASIGPDIDQLAAVEGDDWQLEWIGPDVYDALCPPTSTEQSKPQRWTLWAANLSLYPIPDAAYTLRLRGYRKPVDWVAAGAGAVPDLPDELHNTVATWALAKAYTQQEDPEMGGVYERQFADELTEFKRRIVEMPHAQPFVLNSPSRRGRVPFGRNRFDWEI